MRRGVVESVCRYVAVLILTACNANPAPFPAAARPSEAHGWLSPAAKNTAQLIYVADNDSVLIFAESKHGPDVVGTITDGVSGAYGLCVDRHHNLYVVNSSNGTVTVYPMGSVTPSMTYTGLDGPKYPIVDHDGNLFVSNGKGTAVEFLRVKPRRIKPILRPATKAME
jgi:hypothetical protein